MPHEAARGPRTAGVIALAGEVRPGGSRARNRRAPSPDRKNGSRHGAPLETE